MQYDKTLDELLIPLYNGAKVTHIDWPEGEYIQIWYGEFVDENKQQFSVSPYMLRDTFFALLEE
jgi:hypothetical protein